MPKITTYLKGILEVPICFVPNNYSTAQYTGSHVLFPPNSKFAVQSSHFNKRGCLLVYLSLQTDTTTEK